MESLAAGDPEQIGVYRLQFRLGAGGMGRVFLGFSRAGKAVAVKVVHPELARDPEFVTRFRREVQAARAVSGAYTAPVVAAGPDDDPPWLATAFVVGPSLGDAIALAGPLPEAALWRLAGGLIEALQAVHACGLVHRDLKPANILLAADGPRVIDFGISRAMEGTAVTARSMIVGTAPFMSPEQARGLPVGPPSDVFALGSVIAFAATGAAPFGDGDPVSVAYRVVHAQPGLSAVPVPLRDLIAGCLAKAPAARPPLTRLLDAATARSASFSAASPTAFWPDPVSGLISSWQDSFSAYVPPTVTGPAAAASPSPLHKPAAPEGPGRDGPEATRGRSGSPVGPPTTQREPARESVPQITQAPHGRRPRRRGPLIATAAAVVVMGLAATAIALAVTSHPPRHSSSAGVTAPPSTTPAQATAHQHARAAPSTTPTPPAPATVTICIYPAISCTENGGQAFMKVKPEQIVTSADGSSYMKDITWSSWGNTIAAGTGILEIDDCKPDCAAGAHTGYPATITVSGLTPYGSGAEAYSDMIITAPTAPFNASAYTYRSGLVP